MNKKITIILKKNQSHLGKKGIITKVSRGYAFNYLIPNNIAEIANEKTIKHFQMFETIANKKNEANQIEAKKLNNILQQINKIVITKKSGDKKQFFGSINEKEISKIILECTGKILDKQQISIDNTKNISVSNFNISTYHNIECTLKLHILPENI
uniref:50S ribosomal protein L9, chloroplastic n=1 Tax=Sphondylothamnion multifidum TaxID=193186 RepID=A0A4D6WZ91_9FLOR|nr:ribosomal protein L9 [Sphondylothamnion multifidum]